MATKLKAQSAMEYLMTYGWAILIIIIVVAVLFSLGVFNPSTFTQTTATGFSGFNVPAGGWQVSAAGTLTLQIRNSGGATIQLGQTWAKIGSTDIANTSQPTIVTVGPGQTTTLTFASGVARSAGSSYSAAVNLTYTNVDSGLTGFRSSGTLTGSVS